MKILKQFLFTAWAFFLLFSTVQTAGSAESVEDKIELKKNHYINENIKFEEKELDKFLKAKEYIFKRNWRKARERLASYLKDYPSGQLRDEALYWLAQCLNKISKEQVDKDKVIEHKDKAIKKLDLLKKEYPYSVWTDDAMTLKIEIAGELALMGKSEYNKYILQVIETQKKTESDLKLIALRSLIELQPEAAIPTLERIIKTEKDPQVRKRTILLLGRYYNRQAIAILEDVLKKDSDKEVKKEARYWLREIKLRLIPVNLNYYLFSARLSDLEAFRRIPENKLISYTLSASELRDEGMLKEEINSLFNYKLNALTRQARGTSDLLMGIFDSSFSHKISGFRIQMLKEGFEKKPDKITGKFLFRDLDDEKDYYTSITVDDKNEKLLVMRNGEEVALMLLQFDSKDKFLSYKEKMGEEPLYSTEFSNVLGCRVLSARQSWGWKEYSSDPMDFGQAKAEIPGKKGKWILKGYMILVKKERRFISRKATLINPEGEIAARGDQIIVPVDNPSQYKVTGKKDN